MPRLFFALQPTAEQSASLLADLEARFSGPQITAIPATNLHATLCFLGAVDVERLPALREAASKVRCGSVSLRFDTLEYWPTPQIICATASADVAGANALVQAVSNEVFAAGFTPDIKPFRPHLTLARKVRAAQAEQLALPHQLQPGFEIHSEEFLLMESHRDEHGSVYTAIARWPLDGS